MSRLCLWAFCALLAFPFVAAAQEDPVWIQIEAHPDVDTTRARAAAYATTLADVGGFALGGRWYGIALGPYERADAQRLLRQYRAEGRIPSDSYIAVPNRYGRQIWPQDGPSPTVTLRPAPQIGTGTETTTAPVPVAPADETPAEARRSERALGPEDRRTLQIALQAAGVYSGVIDGVFGAGTRRSMADWQAQRGFDPTGILTTRQRRALIEDYEAPLRSVGMRPVTEREAGIRIDLPAGAVRRVGQTPPFVHFEPLGDLDVRVSLISLPGGAAELAGLFEVMQSLDILPIDGDRALDRTGFRIEGRDRTRVTVAQAQVADGWIKGFLLAWPTGDEARRLRVLAAMEASFTPLEGGLDPAPLPPTTAGLDLLAGLDIRRPIRARSGFYTDDRGTIVTAAAAVDGCARVTVDGDIPFNVVLIDAVRGIAVLEPRAARLAPVEVARLGGWPATVGAPVIVAGFSYEGLLGAPSLTAGRLAPNRPGTDMPGETVSAPTLDGDTGGPILGPDGAVLGVILSAPDAPRVSPGDRRRAAPADAIDAALRAAGRDPRPIATAATDRLSPAALDRLARGLTVLVECWN